MRILISPAKKMKVDTDSLPYRDLPAFIMDAQKIIRKLQSLSWDELKTLWNCNDRLTELNVQRLGEMDLHHRLTPAILAYEGIQYQYMAPGVFTEEAFSYVQEHLRILSGLYGVLRPFDGVTPYRLEMQAKLAIDNHRDLYAFWGDRLAKAIVSETDCIVNLASKEYSVSISKYLPTSVRFITCVFGEEQAGKVVEKGTMCKMARGEMVRFLAQEQIKSPEQIKNFTGLQYRFCPDRSDDHSFVFLRDPG